MNAPPPPAAGFHILTRFPAPPPSLAKVLHQHKVVRRGDADEIAVETDLSDLPRPWTPATCGDELRAAIWTWCDAVADWINHEYAWRAAQLIPPCWPYHPHIAHELPVLALGRHAAQESDGPELLEQWHQVALPTFFSRMLDRLGESTCRTGKHTDWPAESRHVGYNAAPSTQARQAAFAIDTHTRPPLRPVQRP